MLCLVYAAVVALAGYRIGPGGAAAPLVWAAPALWLGGFAVLVAAITRSAVLTSSVVALVWLAEQIWAPLFAGNGLVRPLFLFFTSRLGDGPGWAANRVASARRRAAVPRGQRRDPARARTPADRGGRVTALLAVARYEFRMQARKPSLWIAAALLGGALIVLQGDRGPRQPAGRHPGRAR